MARLPLTRNMTIPELGRTEKTEYLRHNHVTRDIKERGKCPSCDTYWENFDPVDPADQQFAERLVHGAAGQIAELDAALATASHHWKVTRMDKVDRNLLRLGAYEILRCADIPRSASINEAIEIAKRFCGNDSAKFINGVLDQLHKEAGDPEAEGQPDPSAADADALAEAELDQADSLADVLPLALHAARRKPT